MVLEFFIKVYIIIFEEYQFSEEVLKIDVKNFVGEEVFFVIVSYIIGNVNFE